MIRQFLEAVYADVPDGYWYYIWTISADEAMKQTHWAQNVDAAVKAAEQAAGQNVYWPIGLRTQPAPGGKRGEESEIAGIVALVADVDLKDDKHPKAPVTENDALELINAFPLRPSICIHSGHGLQATWLLKEPWLFDRDDERREAKQFSSAWWHTLSAIASRYSYEMDAVHDLTRVMRVPGTVNVKGDPVPVTIRWLEPELRYNEMDFEQYLLDIPTVERTPPLPIIDINTPFPTQEWSVLCDNVPEVLEMYEHKRAPAYDTSTSGYDMSLANYMVQAGFDDDQITAVLITHRQRYGQDKPKKIYDRRYYARTIATARAAARKHEARQEADAVIAGIIPDAETDTRVAAVAKRLEIPLTHVQVVSGEPGIMRLWIGGKCAEIPLTSLDSPAATYKAVINTVRKYPVPIAKNEKPGWRDIVNVLLSTAENVEAGDDATVGGAFASTVAAFFEQHPPMEYPEGEIVEYVTQPFLRGGRIWFRLEEFVRFVNVTDRRLTRQQIVQRLKIIGAETGVHKAKADGVTVRAVRFYSLQPPARVTM